MKIEIIRTATGCKFNIPASFNHILTDNFSSAKLINSLNNRWWIKDLRDDEFFLLNEFIDSITKPNGEVYELVDFVRSPDVDAIFMTNLVNDKFLRFYHIHVSQCVKARFRSLRA